MKKIYQAPTMVVSKIMINKTYCLTGSLDRSTTISNSSDFGAKERHDEDFGDSHTGWTDGLW